MSPLGINSQPFGSNRLSWQGFFSCYKRSFNFSIHLIATKWLICLHEKLQCIFDAYFVWNVSLLTPDGDMGLTSNWMTSKYLEMGFLLASRYILKICWTIKKKIAGGTIMKTVQEIKYLGKWSPMSWRDVSHRRLYTRRSL